MNLHSSGLFWNASFHRVLIFIFSFSVPPRCLSQIIGHTNCHQMLAVLIFFFLPGFPLHCCRGIFRSQPLSPGAVGRADHRAHQLESRDSRQKYSPRARRHRFATRNVPSQQKKTNKKKQEKNTTETNATRFLTNDHTNSMTRDRSKFLMAVAKRNEYLGRWADWLVVNLDFLFLRELS